jgi:hypothetical protein
VYLFDHIQEMSSRNYMPSGTVSPSQGSLLTFAKDNDILRARVRSTGITESFFKVSNLKYRVLECVFWRSSLELELIWMQRRRTTIRASKVSPCSLLPRFALKAYQMGALF